MPAADNLENADLADQEPTPAAVSRRFLLRRAVALGVSAPVLLTVLQACGDDDDEEENGNGAQEGGDETPTAEAEDAAPTPTQAAGTTGGAATPVGAATPLGAATPVGVATPIMVTTPVGAATPIGSPAASPVSI